MYKITFSNAYATEKIQRAINTIIARLALKEDYTFDIDKMSYVFKSSFTKDQIVSELRDLYVIEIIEKVEN